MLVWISRHMLLLFSSEIIRDNVHIWGRKDRKRSRRSNFYAYNVKSGKFIYKANFKMYVARWRRTFSHKLMAQYRGGQFPVRIRHRPKMVWKRHNKDPEKKLLHESNLFCFQSNHTFACSVSLYDLTQSWTLSLEYEGCLECETILLWTIFQQYSLDEALYGACSCGWESYNQHRISFSAIQGQRGLFRGIINTGKTCT